LVRPVDDATRTLNMLSDGDSSAADRLLPLIYADLRALAGSYFRGQPGDHTLEPTALVHEAYLRLIDQSQASWNDRTHFFAVAATAMRQILINHAERRGALKRGGGRKRQPLDFATPIEGLDAELLSLDEALEEMAELDVRKSRVVEMRFFGGLGMQEIAVVLGVSKTTVESDWRMARAWLSRRLSEETID